MSDEAPFQPIVHLLGSGLSIRNVYGEPITQGEVTVVPVARVTCAFGAGGGVSLDAGRGAGPTGFPRGEAAPPAIQGGGGGGALRMAPLGALEIGPRGTRFIPYRSAGPFLVAAALGLAVGYLVAARRR